MTRSRIYQHVPHALLLTGAVVGLSLTSGASQDTHAPAGAMQGSVQTEPQHATEYGRPYMDAEGDTRSIGEIIRQVRARMDSLKKSQESVASDTAEMQAPLSSLIEQLEHRRMVRHRDVEALPKAKPTMPVLAVEYTPNAGAFAPQAPDALAAREYRVLGFGEVGQEQPETSASDTQSIVLPGTSTETAGTVTRKLDSVRTEGNAAFPKVSSTLDNATAPLPAVTTDTPAASATTTPATIQIAQARTAARVAVPTTRSEPEVLATQHASDPTPQTETRMDTPVVSAGDVFTSKALAVNDSRTAATPASKAGDNSRWQQSAQPGAAAPDVNHGSTKTVEQNQTRSNNPFAGYTTSSKHATTNQTSSKTQTAQTTSRPSDDPWSQAVFPTAAKDTASAKSYLDDRKDIEPITPITPSQNGKPTDNALLVYIDDHDKIGSDRVKAIDNALSRINDVASKADLGVAFKVTTDKTTGYNIHFAEDDGQGMGNKLGLAEFAVTEDDHGNEYFLGENSTAGGKAKVSINNAFNWYTGSDAKKIKKDEYDYQTAIEHEFLHLLGLDDDFDNLDSVTHGLLSPGEVRRDIHDREISTLSDLFSSTNLWQSAFNPSSWSKSYNNGSGKTRYHAKALTAVVAPEPASLALIGLGVLGMVQRRRR